MNNEILNQNQSNQNGNKNIIDLKLTNDELTSIFDNYEKEILRLPSLELSFWKSYETVTEFCKKLKKTVKLYDESNSIIENVFDIRDFTTLLIRRGSCEIDRIIVFANILLKKNILNEEDLDCLIGFMSGLQALSGNVLFPDVLPEDDDKLLYSNYQPPFNKYIKEHSFIHDYNDKKVDLIYPNSILILQKKEENKNENECDCNTDAKNTTIIDNQKYECHTFYDFSQKELTELKFCKIHDNLERYYDQNNKDKVLLFYDYLKNDKVILFINLIKKIRTILAEIFILKYYDQNKLEEFCKMFYTKYVQKENHVQKENQFLKEFINNDLLLDTHFLYKLVKDNVKLGPEKTNKLENNNKTNTDKTTTTEIPKIIEKKSSELSNENLLDTNDLKKFTNDLKKLSLEKINELENNSKTTTKISEIIKEKSSDFGTTVLIFIPIITIVGIVIYSLKKYNDTDNKKYNDTDNDDF